MGIGIGAGQALGGVHGGGTGVLQQFSIQAGAHTCGHVPGQIRGSGAGVGTIRGGGVSPGSVGGAVKRRKEKKGKLIRAITKGRISKLPQGLY